jgi:hypothetical protein
MHDLRASLRLDVGRARQVVGVRVGLQRPFDGVAQFGGGAQQRVHRAGIDLAAAGIVVEHRIDHRRLPGGGIGDDVADGIGRFVEKSTDN